MYPLSLFAQLSPKHPQTTRRSHEDRNPLNALEKKFPMEIALGYPGFHVCWILRQVRLRQRLFAPSHDTAGAPSLPRTFPRVQHCTFHQLRLPQDAPTMDFAPPFEPSPTSSTSTSTSPPPLAPPPPPPPHQHHHRHRHRHRHQSCGPRSVKYQSSAACRVAVITAIHHHHH